jgi:hypothetical protein
VGLFVHILALMFALVVAAPPIAHPQTPGLAVRAPRRRGLRLFRRCKSVDGGGVDRAVAGRTGQAVSVSRKPNHNAYFRLSLGPWNFPQVNDTMIPMVANGYVYVCGLNKLLTFSLH